MKYYTHSSHDPRYNLALEEYLFRTASEDLFLLWQNEQSVIIGKNQNPYTEVNLEYTNREKIHVVRRITGGGAVYHDLGNVNYTFISPEGSPEKDFFYFTQPILSALAELGVDARFSGRNDLVAADGRKISGNARCGSDGRVMHHGTLLFDTDLSRLTESLVVNREKIRSKGIASVKSRVVNIKELLPRSIDVIAFISAVESHVKKMYGGEDLLLTDCRRAAIEQLKKEKYDTEQWNMSSRFPFGVTNAKYFPYGLVEASVTVRDGAIAQVKLTGDFFGESDVSALEKLLLGAQYDARAIFTVLNSADVARFITGASARDLCELLININA